MNPRTFRFPFTNLTHVIIPGAVHQLGTSHLIYQAFDTSDPPNPLFGMLRLDPITADFTLDLGAPRTGIVILTAVTQYIF